MANVFQGAFPRPAMPNCNKHNVHIQLYAAQSFVLIIQNIIPSMSTTVHEPGVIEESIDLQGRAAVNRMESALDNLSWKYQNCTHVLATMLFERNLCKQLSRFICQLAPSIKFHSNTVLSSTQSSLDIAAVAGRRGHQAGAQLYCL